MNILILIHGGRVADIVVDGTQKESGSARFYVEDQDNNAVGMGEGPRRLLHGRMTTKRMAKRLAVLPKEHDWRRGKGVFAWEQNFLANIGQVNPEAGR